MFTMLRRGHLLHPEDRGIQDILICGERIVEIGRDLSLPPYPCQQVDLAEGPTIPALIDRHIHLTGGGGEMGFSSRTPAVRVQELVRAGIATVVGVLGTDGVSRSPEDLYAKAQSLQEEGLTSFIYTGSYALPSRTITGDVRRDLIFVDKVVGLKVAIADSRGSYPSTSELLRLASEVRVAGMLKGVVGALHCHVGAEEEGIAVLLELVDKHGFPAKHLQPTHMGRNPRLLEQGAQLARCGGTVDLTTSGAKYRDVWKSVGQLLADGAPLSQLSLSSDGNGSLPRFNGGEVEGLTVANPADNLRALADLVRQGGLSLGDAASLLSQNVAVALGLHGLGRLQPGFQADVLTLNPDFEVRTLACRGRLMVHDGVVLAKGRFDE